MNGTPFSLPVENPVLVFAIAMIIILLAPMAFQRIRVPGIVGLIVTGAIVGPSALGLLARSETFVLLGTVGLLYLMFTAGLTLDLVQFAKRRSRSIVFGLISFALPMALALVLSPTLLGLDLAQAFLVASIVGSHTLLAYPIVQRLGLMKNSAVTVTMGGTMVTDVVSLTILAVVVAATSGTIDASFWIRFIGLVAIYVAAVVLLIPRLGGWFFRSVKKQPDIEFVFLMAILFTAAFLAEVVGLAAIIGAFLVGLATNRLVPSQSPLMTRISFVGDALFIPFFLLSVGLLVDLRVLVSSFSVWGVALLLTGMVLGGKIAAAHLVRAIYKHTVTEGWVIAGLSTPQAAATLAVTLLGYEMGLLTSLFVNAVVVMILLTSLVGPWLVERYGRRLAIEEEAEPSEPSEAPQRILVPLANPETADELMQIAMMIRDTGSDQPLYPLMVTREGGDVSTQVAAAEKLLGHAVVYAAAADVPVNAVTRIDHNIASGIVRAVREMRISTIVIGWNGENTARSYIFGSILDQLLNTTREMVIVSKIVHPVNTTERLFLAVPPYADREPGFPQAIRALKVFAEQSGVDVEVVTTESQRERIEPLYKRTRPDVQTEYRVVPTWSSLIEALDERVTPEDLIVLMNVREGSVAWRSTLNRLPRLIAQRFAESNFLIQYLSEVESGQIAQEALSEERQTPRRAQVAIEPSTIKIGLTEKPDDELLRELIADAHPEAHQSYIDGLIGDLYQENPDYSPELQPGVAFYHLHGARVQFERLVLGVSSEGIRLSGTSKPVHLIIILLVPATVSVEEFLRRLTVVAQLTPPPEMVDQLRELETEDEVREMINARLEGAAPTPAHESQAPTA